MTAICKLEETLTVNEVAALYARLNDALTGETTIILDGSQVEAIDTAAMQLMAAFHGAVQARRSSLRWRDPSPELSNKVALLDLSEQLALSAADNNH